MRYIHKNLALGKWQKMPFYQKIGNIASEVKRASNCYGNGDKKNMQLSLERAMELIDLSVLGKIKLENLKELLRLREVLADYYNDKHGYKNDWEQINRYLLTLFLAKGPN